MTWRARSASDRTDDWPFWYVTDDQPADRNKTIDAIELATGGRPASLPFLPRDIALALADLLNGKATEATP